MRPRATTETIGRTLLLAFSAIAFMACGDSPQENASGGGGVKTKTSSKSDTKAISAKNLARTVAIRNGANWHIQVILPPSLPTGLPIKQVTCSTSKETHTWIRSADQTHVSFDLEDKTPDYEVVITDTQGSTFVTKAQFE